MCAHAKVSSSQVPPHRRQPPESSAQTHASGSENTLGTSAGFASTERTPPALGSWGQIAQKLSCVVPPVPSPEPRGSQRRSTAEYCSVPPDKGSLSSSGPAREGRGGLEMWMAMGREWRFGDSGDRVPPTRVLGWEQGMCRQGAGRAAGEAMLEGGRELLPQGAWAQVDGSWRGFGEEMPFAREVIFFGGGFRARFPPSRSWEVLDEKRGSPRAGGLRGGGGVRAGICQDNAAVLAAALLMLSAPFYFEEQLHLKINQQHPPRTGYNPKPQDRLQGTRRSFPFPTKCNLGIQLEGVRSWLLSTSDTFGFPCS